MKPFSIQTRSASYVCRNGMVIISTYAGSKFTGKVEVPVKEFMKAAAKVVVHVKNSEGVVA